MIATATRAEAARHPAPGLPQFIKHAPPPKKINRLEVRFFCKNKGRAWGCRHAALAHRQGAAPRGGRYLVRQVGPVVGELEEEEHQAAEAQQRQHRVLVDLLHRDRGRGRAATRMAPGRYRGDPTAPGRAGQDRAALPSGRPAGGAGRMRGAEAS